ncbi:MAG: radical SAM protein [Calditrichaeota bacterium]|nr:radical SAM protein [Calditrichota bacterium]
MEKISFVIMKNNNVLLINPWIYDFAAYDFWIKPVGLLSVANFLEEYGYQTHLIDCLDRFHPLAPKTKNKKYGTGKFIRTPVENPNFTKSIPRRRYARYGLPIDAFLRAMDAVPPPMAILVTSGMTYWYPGVKLAIELAKKKFPGVPIILGGIYATLCFDHARDNMGADFVVKGQGEIEALKLVAAIAGFQHDLPLMPPPFPEPTFRHYRKLASAPLFTSVGCPFRCSFCASFLLSGKFRQKDPQAVIDEIRYFYYKRHVRFFAFFDDALFVNHEKHIEVILRHVIENQFQISFHTPNGVHPREITPELARTMYLANFKTIRLSYETINKSRQKEMGNKVSDDSLAQAVNNLVAAGYQARQIDAYVIMGIPGQTVDEVIESMLFVVSLGAKVRLTSFSPLPGTKDWQRSVELYNMPPNIDPLLTNNTLYPLAREDFPVETFEKLRKLSKTLNYGIDNGINFCEQSRFARSFRANFLKFNRLDG